MVVAIWHFFRGVPILLLTASVLAPQPRNPASVWKIVRDMLSAPNGQAVFASTLKGAVISGPGGLTPYLQGSLVSITPGNTNRRRLLLSMENTDTADAAIILIGPNARLKTQPKKGTLIRFEGNVSDFTKEPFVVTFEVDHLTGLDFVNPRAAPFESSN
jgi:hypothetical protein